MVSFKLDGSRYLGVADKMEFIQNDSFALVIYPSERVFTVGKPVPGFNGGLPMAQWDSLFAKNDFTYSVSMEEDFRKITIDYKSNLQSPLKKMEIWYDPVTYLIHQVKYMVTEPQRGTSEIPGDGMVVSIRFSNYQSGG